MENILMAIDRMSQQAPAHYIWGLEQTLEQLCWQHLKLAESPGILTQAIPSTLALSVCLPRKPSQEKEQAHASS